MIIEGAAIGAILVMRLYPELPAARWLYEVLVARPAAWTRRHLIFAALMIGLMFAGGEFVMIAGGADLAMVMAWDMALAFDVFVAVWTAAAVGRVRGAAAYLVARWRGARPRSVRSRQRTLRRDAGNDDEPAADRIAA